MNTKWRKHLGPWLAPIVSLVLLVGAARSLNSRHSPDADKYHERVRKVAASVSAVIGEWYGKNVEVPAPAIELLKPNVLISRDYTNLVTNQKVNVTFVQSRDAYDMMFHYPPVCFPANGWTHLEKESANWKVGGRIIPIMRYGFERSTFDSIVKVNVVNVFIMTDGMRVEMESVRNAARNPSRRPYGAAQVQFVFDAGISDADQQIIFSELMAALLPLADDIQNVNTEAEVEQLQVN